jgi:hypothetical protein
MYHHQEQDGDDSRFPQTQRTVSRPASSLAYLVAHCLSGYKKNPHTSSEEAPPTSTSPLNTYVRHPTSKKRSPPSKRFLYCEESCGSAMLFRTRNPPLSTHQASQLVQTQWTRRSEHVFTYNNATKITSVGTFWSFESIRSPANHDMRGRWLGEHVAMLLDFR